MGTKTQPLTTLAETPRSGPPSDVPLSFEEAASYALFKHVPLDRTRQAIRVVSVHPNLSSTGRLRVTIRETADNEDRYLCLSYTWGKCRDYRVISLNGRGFAVRSHLWDFLNAARELYPNQAFWIDALCIDQGSINEVNHQIRLMDRIFSNAMGVVIWLGKGDEPRYAALRFLAQGLMDAPDPAGCHAPNDVVGEALTSLCEDEYWGRTWIIQEVLLAKAIVLMSGTTTCPWAQLAELLIWKIKPGTGEMTTDAPKNHSLQLEPETARLWDSRARLFCMERILSSGQMHQCSLRDLLVRFGRSRCSDVRDRVLGLLALTDYGANEDFKVDYSQSAAQLYAYLMSFYEMASVRNGRTLLYILELDVAMATSVPISLEFAMAHEHVSTSLFIQPDHNEASSVRVCTYCGIELSKTTPELADGVVCCFFQDQLDEHLMFDRRGHFQAFAVRESTDAVSPAGIQTLDRKASFLRNMVLKRHVDKVIVTKNGRSEWEDEITYTLGVDERALAYLLFKGCVDA